MKRSYTLRLFLLALGLFWLSLLLTVGVRTSLKTPNDVSLNYTQMDGIESIHFDKNLFGKEQYSHYSLDISYVDQPHISVEFDGIQNDAAIQSLFKRDGTRLIFQPIIRSKDKNKHHENSAVGPYHEGWWNIKQINLPLQIQKITTQGIDLDIDSSMPSLKEKNDQTQTNHENKTKIHLSRLDIEAKADSIDINDIHIGTLQIRNHAEYTLCEDGIAYAYDGGSITIRDQAKIDDLLIESRGGRNITLHNTASIKNMTLHTAPDIGIELDRIDAYQRMNWKPLPPLKRSDIRPDSDQGICRFRNSSDIRSSDVQAAAQSASAASHTTDAASQPATGTQASVR